MKKKMKEMKIDWSKQHNGVIQGDFLDVIELMPDVADLIANTFPITVSLHDYIWDVKVHMLMPNQYPCIPNWHRDMVPRDKYGKEDESKINEEHDMWLYLSGAPLTLFRDEEGKEYEIEARKWKRFTQRDYHKGQASKEFTWRGLIRASHKGLRINDKDVNNPFENKSALRRHSQVYLDANNFNW